MKAKRDTIDNNIKMLYTEIDKYKTRYSGVFSRQTILNEIEKHKNELAILQQIETKHLRDEKRYEIEYQKAYYKGAIQAFILVLSHKEEEEVLLQKRWG